MMIASLLRRGAWMFLLASACAPAVNAAQTAAQPTLEIQALDGKTFNLAAERGKWVIVNFWAT